MKPTVSVIIPVLNNCSQLKSTIRALAAQTYPSLKIEIIVVDNGSDEDMLQCTADYPVTLLYETDQKSPYAARNRGIEASSGEIIALTDSNKTPAVNWIEEGVQALMNRQADLAGGKIGFALTGHSAPSEVFDATFFNNNKTLVSQEKAAVTGNLFIRRHLFDTVGLFPGELRSGMDVWWTQRAVRQGFKLVYAERAQVICEPRTFRDLMKKSFRVGVSHPFIRHEAGEPVWKIMITILRTLAPPGPGWLRKNVSGIYHSKFLFRIWLVAWSYKGCLAAGRFRGLLNLNKIKRTLKP